MKLALKVGLRKRYSFVAFISRQLFL